MDSAFGYFLQNFGPPIAKRDVDPAYAGRYRGRLPEKLLEYWTEHGFSGYGDGLFWTVDPADYAGLLEAELPRTPFQGVDHFHVVARSGFGVLFVWGETSGWNLAVDYTHGILSSHTMSPGDSAVEAFFASRQKSLLDSVDEAGKPLFARARKKLGLLDHDEMYGFEPALAFGGKASLTNLRKLKIFEHLEILAQISAPRVLQPVHEILRKLGKTI